MIDSAERSLSRFYNSVGWESADGSTEDAKLWEDLRDCAKRYASKSRLRVLRHLPRVGQKMLDMASGPIQYPEYLRYSQTFETRYCVDLSALALQKAKEQIGDRGVFLQGNFLELPMEDNFFDCAISLHTIYHFQAGKQEWAVRKLIQSVKPGAPVVIVYSNPYGSGSLLQSSVRAVKSLVRRLRGGNTAPTLTEESTLYFHTHPLEWWQRFGDVAHVKVRPWRTLTSDTQRALVPDNLAGKAMLFLLFVFEELFPSVFVRFGRYPMIVLTKKR